MSCKWCDEGSTRVVSSIDPEGKTFVHHTAVGRVVCGETPVARKAIAAPAIVYCAWCKTIQLNLENVFGCVVIFPDEDNRHAYVNGIPTTIADGICPHCRATRFPEFPKKVTHDLATK